MLPQFFLKKKVLIIYESNQICFILKVKSNHSGKQSIICYCQQSLLFLEHLNESVLKKYYNICLFSPLFTAFSCA